MRGSGRRQVLVFETVLKGPKVADSEDSATGQRENRYPYVGMYTIRYRYVRTYVLDSPNPIYISVQKCKLGNLA